MAYLKKPNRLFTSKPQNTIGGGTIQGENLGSRTGFAQITKLTNKGPNQGKYSLRRRDPENPSAGNKQFYFDTKAEALAFDKEATKKGIAAQKEKLAAQQARNAKLNNEFRESINNWVTNWFNENANKYDIRDGDKAIKQLQKDYKNSGIEKPKGIKADVFSADGNFPNILSKSRSTNFGYAPFGLTEFMEDSVSPERSLQSYKYFFQRAFLKKKVMENPELKNKVERYMEYVSLNKRPGAVENLNLLKEQYADVLNDADDITFLLSDDSGLKGIARSSFLKDTFNNYQIYADKVKGASLNYKKNIAAIEKALGPEKLKEILGGEESILKFMEKENSRLKNLFDTKDLPKELKYSLDHNIGIADISRLSKPEMEKYLRSLIGMTVNRNFELGWRGGYSAKKKSYISKINQGINVDENLNLLNNLTKDVYPELKGKNAYKIDNGKLNVTKDFYFPTDEKQRFRQYFTEIAGTEKGTEQLVKQSSQNPELLKFLKSIETDDFKNIGKVVNLYQKEKLDLKGKLSDLYCGKKEGGRIGFADGPTGFACSIDEIQTNMKRDLQTPEGKSRVSKLIRGAGSVLKNVIAPVDAVIESAFMLPSLLAGDPNAALNNTTLGLIPYFNTTGVEKAQKLLDKGYIDQNQYNEIIQGFKADEAVAGIMKNINDTDQLILSNQNIGIVPDEKGNFKTSKASPERVAELTQNFGKKFIELAKERENLVAENQQYAPALATAQGMSKTYNAFRQGLIKEATTPLSQLPYSENIGMRDIITDIGKQLGTGEFLRKQKMQDPRFVVEGVGDPYFDYMNQYYSPYMEDVRSGFTGKDPRDRFADLPVSAPSALAQTEKMDYIQGMTPFLENMYRKQGPQVLQSFAEQQGIDLSQFPLKGVPNMKQGGRIHFSNGGRLSFAEGPEDPSKRKTLKKMGIAGGITGGVMTGLINILDLFKGGAKKGVVATKAAESEAQKIFFDLVDAVKNKGIMNKLDDVFETKVGVEYEYKGVKVLEDGENIEVRFETDKGAPAVVEYRKPGYEVDPDAQTSYKVPGEFIGEGQQIGRYGKDGDVDLDFEEEIIDSIDEVKKIAKGVK